MSLLDTLKQHSRSGYQPRFRDISDADQVKFFASLAKRGISTKSWLMDGDRSHDLTVRNEAKRAANTISAEMKAMLEGKDQLSAAEKVEYDNSIDTLDALGLLISDVNRKMELEDLTRGAAGGGQNNAWRDREGGAIRVLSRSERMADLGDAPRISFGFGEYVRAMVLGTQSPDIRAALSEGTDSAGGFTVPTQLLRQLIDAMRAKAVCVQAGAMTVPLDTAQNVIVRIASDPAAGWRLENASVAESDPTFEGITLAPKSLAVLVKVSRELLDDSLNLSDALTLAFAGALAAEVDRVCLVGSGTAPEPRGIFNTTSINSVSMGTNGAALTDYGPLLDGIYEIELDNGPSPTAAVMHPRTKRVISGFADTTGQPLMPPIALTDVKSYATTNLPITQTQGTASDASAIIVGDFTQLLLGVRQQLRIEVLRESFADKLQYGFLAHLRFDVALAQPEAFCAVKGIVPA